MTAVLSPSNVLPHSERLRLIRSVKKLGDLLTDAHEMLPPSPSSSSPHARNLFSLRIPKALAGIGDDRSPLSPTFTLSLNSPSTPVIDPETLKERRLAKVIQTLGENVPADLVLSNTVPVRKGRRRASTTSVPADYASIAAEAHRRTVAAAGAAVVGRRRHARELSRALQHAASSASLKEDAPPMDTEPFSYASLIAVPVSSFEEFSGHVAPSVEFGIESSDDGMYREELGWSGEWSGSVKNMADVVRGLRELRLK